MENNTLIDRQSTKEFSVQSEDFWKNQFIWIVPTEEATATNISSDIFPKNNVESYTWWSTSCYMKYLCSFEINVHKWQCIIQIYPISPKTCSGFYKVDDETVNLLYLINDFQESNDWKSNFKSGNNLDHPYELTIDVGTLEHNTYFHIT